MEQVELKQKFNFPRPGTYYIFATFRIGFSQKVNINVTIEDCAWADHASGPECEAEYNHDNPLTTVKGVLGSYYYWAVYYITPTNPLRVSVYPQPGKPLPNIYASRGNIPQKGNAEISNCNIAGCSSTNIITWTPSANETWYVAVTPAVDGTPYAIWFGSTCYPGCQNGGTCVESGPTVGTCTCKDPEDHGVACEITTRVSQQFVVLGAIWGTAIAVTIVVLITFFMTSQKQTYERIA